jgi:hypothetical protein
MRNWVLIFEVTSTFMMTKLPVLQLIHQNDLRIFIDFWKKLYFYPLENLYNKTIVKRQFDIDDIQQLFIWKNNMKLSEVKQLSLDTKVKAKLKIINSYKADATWTVTDFQNNFKELSAVWKIFLLHIIKPDLYPIYDQHINRTYNFIHGLSYKEISANMPNPDKEKFYFDTYLPFIQGLNNCDLKSIDEAFFSFGQFINTNKNEILFVESEKG